MIEAMGKHAASLAVDDPEAAARAYANLTRRALREDQNNLGVARVTIEELRENPPSARQSDTGDEQLSEEFLTRFERYAADASTDELRATWGRILASEVRSPGSVSRKLMRVVDELNPVTAKLFQRFIEFRIGKIVPLISIGELSIDEKADLVGAGLLVEPGLTGKVAIFSELRDGAGRAVWFRQFEGLALGFAKDIPLDEATMLGSPISMQNGVPGVAVYVLTDVAIELAEIFSNHFVDAFNKMAGQIAAALPDNALRIYSQTENGFQVLGSVAKPAA